MELPSDLALALERHVYESTLDLPVLAEAASQVMRMALDEGGDAGKLAETLKRDPALASHLIRVANSPVYRGRTAIVSLQQAVTRLGMKKVRDMALAIVCESRVFRVRGYEHDLSELFRHCLKRESVSPSSTPSRPSAALACATARFRARPCAKPRQRCRASSSGAAASST